MPRHESIRKRSRSEIRKLMRKLNSRQREELFIYAGPFLDVEKIPAEVWDRWEREINDEFAALIGIIFLLTWDRFRRLVPMDWSAWPIDRRRIESMQDFARDRAKFFSETYVENTRKAFLESELTRREVAIRQALGPDREEVVAVTETATVIPAAESSYVDQAQKANPNVTLVATWKHHDHRPPGHSRAEVNPCPTCSPLEGLRSENWPEKFKRGPPAHPNCDCHLEWEVVLKQQDA